MVHSPAEALAVLGIGPDADAEEIRRAFRRRARSTHPDAGGSAEDFARLQSAMSLLLARPQRPAPPASPSTGTTFRPSTDGAMAGPAWGESTDTRWHDGGVDTTTVDWDLALADGTHPWSRDLVAVALAGPGDGPVTPIVGRSRRPGAFLNRFAGAISNDLLASFTIAAATTRGAAGHDVEILLRTPPGRARRRLDEASLDLGWTRERRPDSTVASLLLHPSRDRRATAVRCADRIQAAATALDWPLTQWRGGA